MKFHLHHQASTEESLWSAPRPPPDNRPLQRGTRKPAAWVCSSSLWKVGAGPLIPEPPSDLMVHTLTREQPGMRRGVRVVADPMPHGLHREPGSPTSVFPRASEQRQEPGAERPASRGGDAKSISKAAFNRPWSWPQDLEGAPRALRLQGVLPSERRLSRQQVTTVEEGATASARRGAETTFRNCLGR